MNTDQKSSKKELDPLPESTNEFWKDAEKVIVKLGPDRMCMRGEHEFRREKQREAKCVKCPMGFLLSGTEELVGGHIYLDSILLI